MKLKPGPLAAWGAMAALTGLLMAGCAGYGDASDDSDAPTEAAAPVDEAATTAVTTTPPSSSYSMPAAGGAPGASPAVPPPVYPSPNATYPDPITAPPPVAEKPDVMVPDAQLLASIKSALAAHSSTRGLKVQITAHEGVVRLTGGVPSSVQVDQLTSVIDDVPGVKEINNLLKVGHR